MALQTFELRLLDKVGEALAGDLGLDTEMLDDWLIEGARYVISKQPPQLWRLFAKEDAAFAPTTGLTVEGHKIVDVFRNDGTIDQSCRQIPENLRGRALDSDDINYATVTDPNWYVDSSTTATPTLKIIPVSVSNIAKVRRLNFPTIDASADSSINGFPDELEDLVVIFALIQIKLREMGLSRRDSQTEIEAITDSGILTKLATAYTDIETALDASTTQNGKISTILDLANTEFDKMPAIIDLTNTEIDKISAIIDEANTAIDLVSTTITTANTEFDLMKNHTATAVVSISTDEDIELGGSELSMAQTAGSTGDKYLGEGAMDLQKAQGFLAEVSSRLQQASSYLGESQARKSTGAAYIDEALARARESQSFLAEASARIGKGQLYLGECNVRLGTASAYTNQSAQAKGEHDTLSQKLEKDLKDWISVNLI